MTWFFIFVYAKCLKESYNQPEEEKENKVSKSLWSLLDDNNIFIFYSLKVQLKSQVLIMEMCLAQNM